MNKNIYLIVIMVFFLSSCCFFCKEPNPYFLGEPCDAKYLKQVEEIKMNRAEYIARNKNLSERIKRLIEVGLIEEGMNEEQVKASLGYSPEKVETAVKYGADEMWFYRGIGWNDYLYFRDGILINVDHEK